MNKEHIATKPLPLCFCSKPRQRYYK